MMDCSIIWPATGTRVVVQRLDEQVRLYVLDATDAEILFAHASLAETEILHPPHAPVSTLRVGGAFVQLGSDELVALVEAVLHEGAIH